MNIIGGKWKPSIIYMIRTDRNRYSLLLKNITEISKQTLTNQLRELEKDGIIDRIIYPEIPPRVEYKITPYGSTLLPIIDSMSKWALQNMPKKNIVIQKLYSSIIDTADYNRRMKALQNTDTSGKWKKRFCCQRSHSVMV